MYQTKPPSWIKYKQNKNQQYEVPEEQSKQLTLEGPRSHEVSQTFPTAFPFRARADSYTVWGEQLSWDAEQPISTSSSSTALQIKWAPALGEKAFSWVPAQLCLQNKGKWGTGSPHQHFYLIPERLNMNYPYSKFLEEEQFVLEAITSAIASAVLHTQCPPSGEIK